MDEDRPGGVHARPDNSDSPTETRAETSPSRAPKSIGGYRIKRVLATGGMGTVYEALQEQPRRPVAVKVMKHGVASRSAMRRFEYESQLLARLRHPGIAQIYEAGTYDDGSGPVPFFAMEYIRNAKTITQYAVEKKLGTRERLELFIRVCDAAHHGHQKGIIHRDLKPGNILVDSHGEVKIIDFGVARGTDSDLAVTTLQTDIGQLLGTLQYMSPEQCEGDPHDIDTRSDVYSMGVVLYELLSGRMPYNVSRAKIFESTRVIREEQPTSLSTVNSSLRGDVETIVSKAVEKDRDRRYHSAAEMGADIKRYLDGEAITARPPSLTYQLRVFARRNKPLVAAVTAVFLALAIGLVAVTTAYVRIQRAQAEAEQAQRMRLAAEQQAERDRAEAHALRPIEQRVGHAIPSFSTTTLDGEAVGAVTFGNNPATVLNFVAANCPFSTRKVRALNAVRTTYGRAGVRFVNVTQTFKKKRYSATDVALLFNGQGWDWELVYDATNVIGRLLNIHSFPTMVIVDREGTIVDVGRPGSRELANRLAALTDDKWVGDVKRPPGKPGDIQPAAAGLSTLEELCRRRLEVQRRVLGEGAPATAEAISELADLRMAQGDEAEAEALYRQAIEIYRRTAGDDHTLTQSVIDSLVDLLRSQNRMDDAREFVLVQLGSLKQGTEKSAEALNEYAWSLLTIEPADLRDPETALRVAQKAVALSGGNDPLILDTLAVAYQMTGKLDEAIETQKRAVALLPPEPSADRTSYETTLCNMLRARADPARAEPVYRELLAQRRAALPPDHADVATAMMFLGLSLIDQDRHDEAETVLRECLAIRKQALSSDHWDTSAAMSALGAALYGQGRFADAEPLLLDSYGKLRSNVNAPPKSSRTALKRIVALYAAWGKPDSAREFEALLASAGGTKPAR